MTNKIPALIEIHEEEQVRTFIGTFESPVMEIEKTRFEIPYLSTSTWLPGRMIWSNPKLEIYDYRLSEFDWINEWARMHTNYMSGRIGNVTDYKKHIAVTTAIGESVIKWTLIGAQIISMNIDRCYDIANTTVCVPEILFSKLTRKVLIEKSNHPTMQMCVSLELGIDKVLTF